MIKQKLYCAGDWIDTGNYLDVHYPFNNEVIGNVSIADTNLMDQAIAKAHESLAQTARLEPYQKADILDFIVQKLEEQREEFATILVQENGKTIKEARGEMARCISTFKLASSHAFTPEGDAYELGITPASAGRMAVVKRFPIGVIAGIVPFNFPMNLAAHKIAPAIAAGCPIVIKPASATPLSILKFAKIIEASKWPKQAFSVIPCDRKVGQQLVEDSRINLLSFTGSPSVGWKLKSQAGKKKVTLELGGNAALIIDKNINDWERVIERTKIGAFYQAGQSCISVQRIYCHQDVYDTFKEKFNNALQNVKVGDPMSEDTFIGGVIDQKNKSRLEDRIDEAIEHGASCVFGNEGNGTVLKPTLLENVEQTTQLFTQEAFGPVAILYPYSNLQEVIEQVNNSTFGLQVGIFSDSVKDVLNVFEQCHVGGVIHNDIPSYRVDSMPYGGIKDSGLGREGIKYAIEDMSELKVLVLDKQLTK